MLSDEWGWDKDGVEILGSVPISTGTGSLIQFPLRHVTLKFLRKTTSTAVYVAQHHSRPSCRTNLLLVSLTRPVPRAVLVVAG